MSITNIQSSAMLFKLNISVATGSRKDANKTTQVNHDSGVSNVATVRKNIFTHSKELPKLIKVSAMARNRLAEGLVIWEKEKHLIPNSMLMEHMKLVNDAKTAFEEGVENFKAELPMLIETAPEAMGSLYDPSDYPTVAEIPQYIEDRFKFRYSYEQINDSKFFGTVENSIADELTALHQQNVEEQMTEFQGRLWKEFKHSVDRWSAQLTDNADGSKSKRMNETLYTEAERVVRMLELMNYNNDPEMEEYRQSFASLIESYPMHKVKDVEENKSNRSTMKADVDNIKRKVDEISAKFTW